MSEQKSSEEELGEMLSQEMIRADAIWDEARKLLDDKSAVIANQTSVLEDQNRIIAQQAETIRTLRAALEEVLGVLSRPGRHPEIDCPICPSLLIVTDALNALAATEGQA